MQKHGMPCGLTCYCVNFLLIFLSCILSLILLCFRMNRKSIVLGLAGVKKSLQKNRSQQDGDIRIKKTMNETKEKGDAIRDINIRRQKLRRLSIRVKLVCPVTVRINAGRNCTVTMNNCSQNIGIWVHSISKIVTFLVV